MQTAILSILARRRDYASIQAVLQISRAFQLQASSLIRALEILDDGGLSRFPRHATLTSMCLNMVPSLNVPCRMAMPATISWLASVAGGSRLRSVTHVTLVFPREDQVTPDAVGALGHAFPALTALTVYALKLCDQALGVSLFTAFGRDTPNLRILKLMVAPAAGWLAGAGVDWAAFLPRGLHTLHLPFSDLHPELLHGLMKLPQLETLMAGSIGADMSIEQMRTKVVHSEGCVWRSLRLYTLPSFWKVCSFTRWPSAFSLGVGGHSDLAWSLGPPSPEQTRAVRLAAERLAACLGVKDQWGKTFTLKWEPQEAALEAASTAGVISLISPLAARMASLRLDKLACYHGIAGRNPPRPPTHSQPLPLLLLYHRGCLGPAAHTGISHMPRDLFQEPAGAAPRPAGGGHDVHT